MSEAPRVKGKKTTIVWMIAAVGVIGLVIWRSQSGPVPPRDTPHVQSAQKTEDPAPQAAEAASTAAPPSRRNGLKSELNSKPSAADQPQLPGVWFDVKARAGTTAATVIALHGRGDTARNFGSITRGFSAALAWRVLEGPLNFGKGRQWFESDQVRRDASAAKATLDLVRAHIKSIDGPVVLVGFSQGCMTILHLAAEGADKVSAAACIGGWLIGEPAWSATARFPLLFVNGANDQIAKPASVRAAIQAFENRGFATEQIEFGGGHQVPMEEAPRISEWLIAKARAR